MAAKDIGADAEIAEAGRTTGPRDRFLDWRGAVEGFERSRQVAVKAIGQVIEADGKLVEEAAINTVWMLGLDEVWQHVEALRQALASKQVPDVAAALRAEAERLHRRADALTARPLEKGAALREALEALRGLEKANDALCALRSKKAYLTMLDDVGATEALIGLDEARREARRVVAKHVGHVDEADGDGASGNIAFATPKERDEVEAFVKSMLAEEVWVDADKGDVCTGHGMGKVLLARCAVGDHWQRSALSIATGLNALRGLFLKGAAGVAQTASKGEA